MKNFIKSLTIRDIGILLAIVFLIFWLKSCDTNSKLKERLAVNDQNSIALTDSIRREVSQRDSSVNYYKALMVAEKSDLENLNKGLFDRIDSLQKIAKIRGDLLTVQNIGTQVNSDPFEIMAEVYYISKDGSVHLELQYDTIYDDYNSRSLAGYIEFDVDSTEIRNAKLRIESEQINMGMTTGITKNNGTYEIFVSSTYPGFSITRLEGAVLDPKMLQEMVSSENSFVVGPQFGYGFNFGSQNPAPFIGIGVTYNLNKEVKKIFK